MAGILGKWQAQKPAWKGWNKSMSLEGQKTASVKKREVEAGPLRNVIWRQ